MTKKQKQPEQAEMSSVDGFITVSSGGFPPNWNPEADGETVDIIPIAIRSMKQMKKTKRSASAMKQGYVFDAEIVATRADAHFTQGSGKNQVEIEVQAGTVVSLNLNAALMGESENDRKIAYQKNEKSVPEFTLLTQHLVDIRGTVRIVFHGTVPLGGGRSVKRFEILVPKTTLDALTIK